MCFWGKHVRGYRKHAQSSSLAGLKMERTHDKDDMKDPAAQDGSRCNGGDN